MTLYIYVLGPGTGTRPLNLEWLDSHGLATVFTADNPMMSRYRETNPTGQVYQAVGEGNPDHVDVGEFCRLRTYSLSQRLKAGLVKRLLTVRQDWSKK